MSEYTPSQQQPLSVQDYFGEAVLVILNDSLRSNATMLLSRVNRLMKDFGEYRRVVRGFAVSADKVYTPEQYEMFLPSKHQTAQAVDLADPEGDLDQWLLDNQGLLKECGLWAEHPAATRGHCHLQSIPPKGRSRGQVFYP